MLKMIALSFLFALSAQASLKKKANFLCHDGDRLVAQVRFRYVFHQWVPVRLGIRYPKSKALLKWPSEDLREHFGKNIVPAPKNCMKNLMNVTEPGLLCQYEFAFSKSEDEKKFHFLTSPKEILVFRIQKPDLGQREVSGEIETGFPGLFKKTRLNCKDKISK